MGEQLEGQGSGLVSGYQAGVFSINVSEITKKFVPVASASQRFD
jgi:hypothetical protein